MGETTTLDAMRPLKAVCGLIAAGAIAVFVFRSLGRPLWMDELLSLALVRAESLPKLWSGITLGIDGNPPLYFTAAWLIAHVLPQGWTVAALKVTNVAMATAGTFALYRVSRRMTSALAGWIGAFLFAALNDNLVYAALELRTYAAYFLMAALAVLFQQRLIERRGIGDAVVLALIYAALTLSHTFGIIYVACIAIAGWLSQLRDARSLWPPIAIAVLTALVVLTCWVPFLLQQSAVQQPYLWYTRPGIPDLLETLFASRLAMWIACLEFFCLASAALLALRSSGVQWRAALYGTSWQPHRYAALVVAGITGFTLAAWMVSALLFPLFVPRYFVPQLIVSFALHVAFAEWLVSRATRDEVHPAVSAAAITLPAVLLAMAMVSKPLPPSAVSCVTPSGNDFEADYVDGDLPVVTESPHLWLPRATYAAHGNIYLFALDWNVVLKYPERARGNAVDFHIMENLRNWAHIDQIMPTEEILRKYPQFLVIEESGRAWFHNLRTTRDVTAQKLAEVAEDGQSCTLWHVTGVKVRP